MIETKKPSEDNIDSFNWYYLFEEEDKLTGY